MNEPNTEGALTIVRLGYATAGELVHTYESTQPLEYIMLIGYQECSRCVPANGLIKTGQDNEA